ncbi:hypothetical protein FRC12_003882 [Ceratobasidium sp. 428]|nr:hypothetical protein FRC12_003882 [Ceratobasidium sp. 428]
METKHELPPEDFDYVSGSKGLNAYALRWGPPTQACPHMQGADFYQLVDSPQARKCQACQKMWYCSPECQKELWETHKQTCVNQFTPLPMYASGLQSLGAQTYPSTMLQPTAFSTAPPAQGTSQMAQWGAQPTNRLDLDVSDALLRGVVNRNAMGRKPAYDQLTPALVALFGRHAPASQRLIWCDTRSNDDATKKARENFTKLRGEIPKVMEYAHSKFIATRMRGAFVFSLDIPFGSGDYLLGRQRFNWFTYADAQMTLCVKLQEVIRSYDPSKAFVVIMYALSPDQLSAALWVWTYTERSRGDSPTLLDLRTEIRQIMKDTKRGEKYTYSINKDQNDP